MMALIRANDKAHLYVSEFAARVVAESGISSDQYHLGKLILRGLKDAPDFVLQIDATTGLSETNSSVLRRSVRCAVAFQQLGLKAGDNIVLMAPNHLDLTIPYYAAFYIGVGVATLDALLTNADREMALKLIEPKMIFIQNERAASIKEALRNSQVDATVVTFDDSNDCINFQTFLATYGEGADENSFRGAYFNPATTMAILGATSGSTGLPKLVPLTHKNIVAGLPYGWLCGTKFPTPTRLALVMSPIQWITAAYHFMFSPILRYTRLQCSGGITAISFMEIVNKYKPTYTIATPQLIIMLTRPEVMAKCDISCFEIIIIGGSSLPKESMENIRKLLPKTFLVELYGITESGALPFYDNHPVPGSIGKPVGVFDYRLVNPDTKEDVTEPHVAGELWLRGPSVFKGYYKQPEMTQEVFEKEGWFKTGDIFYRDENYFFFFVDRLKLILKHKNLKISPLELESIIQRHPGVLNVAVTGVPDPAYWYIPVACVIKKPGQSVTTQEIKDIVRKSKSEFTQLQMGVIFAKEIPMTATNKVNRKILKDIAAQNMPRE